MKKNSMKGASWDSMFLTFVRILTTLFSIIQTKLLATGLSLTEYGTYSQANIIIAVGTSLVLLGFGDAINYFYNNETVEERREVRLRIVNTIFFLEIVVGVLFALLVLFGRGAFAAYFSNDALKPLLLIVSLKPMLENLMYFYQLLYISTGQAKIIALRNLVIMVLKIAAMYVTIFVLKDLMWIFIALMVLDLLQLLFFKLHFQRNGFVVKPFQISAEYIGKIMAYSLPMGVYALTNALSREMNKLVIGRLTDTETLAIYANCSKILPFDLVAVSFATVLIPYIMRYVSAERKEDAATLFRNYMKIGYYSIWILGTAVLITSTQVITMLYSAEYVQGNTVFIIYVVDSMVKFASMHLILTAGGKAKTIMTYSLVALVLNFVLNILFYYLFGINGPAIATLVTTAGYTYMILRSSIRLIHVRWRDVFDFKDIGAFLLILLLTGVGFYGLNCWLLRMEVNQFVAMLISAGGYCVLNLILNWKRITTTLQQVNELRI